MNEVFIDTETTGLSFNEGHKIVEIACIETKDLISTGRVFHKLINPQRDVPDAAFKVHGFSNGELGLIKKNLIDSKLVIDSLEVARNKFPGSSNSLDALCKKFNIDLSKRTKHNALLDCELLREVYINLLDVKEPKFNLSSNSSKQSSVTKNSYNKKVVEISESEVNMHKDFIKKELKKNFY